MQNSLSFFFNFPEMRKLLSCLCLFLKPSVMSQRALMGFLSQPLAHFLFVFSFPRDDVEGPTLRFRYGEPGRDGGSRTERLNNAAGCKVSGIETCSRPAAAWPNGPRTFSVLVVLDCTYD